MPNKISQKQAAKKWAKTAEDAVFVLGKLSNKLVKETVQKMVENLYEETDENLKLSMLAASFINNDNLRKTFEKELCKVIESRFSSYMDKFPEGEEKESDIFRMPETSLSGYYVTDEFFCDDAIYKLWKATENDLAKFNFVISKLNKKKKDFVWSRISKSNGNFEFFNFDLRANTLCEEMLKRGYKIKKDDYFIYGWNIKRPKLLGRSFNIVGYDDLEGFYRKEIGEPYYSTNPRPYHN